MGPSQTDRRGELSGFSPLLAAAAPALRCPSNRLSAIVRRPQDIDYPVPSEYLINVSIRDKLAPLTKMKHYKDDLLFFLFYTNCGDVMQLMAANEL